MALNSASCPRSIACCMINKGCPTCITAQLKQIIVALAVPGVPKQVMHLINNKTTSFSLIFIISFEIDCCKICFSEEQLFGDKTHFDPKI